MPSIQIHRMCPDSYNMYINSGFFFFLLLSQKLNCSVILHKLPMTWVYVCGCKMNMQNILALACLRQTIKCRAHETSKHIALLRFAHSHVCTIWLILCDIAKYNSAISESIHFKRFSLSICFSWARCLFFSFSLFFWLLLLLVFFFSLTEIHSFIYASFHWWKSIRLIFILYWDIKSCLPSIADVHAFDFILVGVAKWTICMRRCDKQKKTKNATTTPTTASIAYDW